MHDSACPFLLTSPVALRAISRAVLLSLLLGSAGCASTESAGSEGESCLTGRAGEGPSEDPSAYAPSTEAASIAIESLRQVVPSEAIPVSLGLGASNNNLDLAFHGEELLLAWRSAPTHFASSETVLWVASSADRGESWTVEEQIALETDIREPRLLSLGDRLWLYYFEAGSEAWAFEPQRIWRAERCADGSWAEPEIWLDEPDVPWDLSVRDGVAWMTRYRGEHYTGVEGGIEVLLSRSEDGEHWEEGVVYTGGVSEVAIEPDAQGRIWAVGRNEDGDETGYGAQICRSSAEDPWDWTCLEESDPQRYDSPELIRRGEELYLLARRDIGGSFGEEGGDLISYSLRPKTTALYRLDQERWAIEHIMDLPGVGDTAFPAPWPLDSDRLLVGNYSSPLEHEDWTWVEGQTSEEGTQIWFFELVWEEGAG